MITFKNSAHLSEICYKIPLNKILVETDSPYLSPHPFRGKINHPENTLLVVKKIAEIKNKSMEDISKITTCNFNKLFNIEYKKIINENTIKHAIILPLKENFSSKESGAVSIWVNSYLKKTSYRKDIYIFCSKLTAGNYLSKKKFEYN